MSSYSVNATWGAFPGAAQEVALGTDFGAGVLNWDTGAEGPTLETGEQGTLTYGGDFPTVLSVTVIGFTAAGDVVVEDTFGQVFVLTNQTYDVLQTLIYDDPGSICFLAGTRIATPSGEVPVETLRRGDLVLTADGRALPVRFLGQQTLTTMFTNRNDLPIRIVAGALGECLPTRDLFVSPAHAIAFDDVLVQAGALVNGTTISQVTTMPPSFAYYHVEVAEHVLLLAEGVATESFIDSITPSLFHNSGERPNLPPIPELDMPRAQSHRQVPPEIRALIAGRAVVLGGLAAAAA